MAASSQYIDKADNDGRSRSNTCDTIHRKLQQSYFSFHKKCGSNVEITNQGRTAFRKSPEDYFNNGVAITEQILIPNERFQVQVVSAVEKWSGNLEVGLTSLSPDTLDFPPAMTDCDTGVTIMWSGNTLQHNGEVVQYLKKNLDDCTIGDTVRMVTSENATLHLYLNGDEVSTFDLKDIEDADGKDFHCVVDLYGSTYEVAICGKDYEEEKRAITDFDPQSKITESEYERNPDTVQKEARMLILNLENFARQDLDQTVNLIDCFINQPQMHFKNYHTKQKFTDHLANVGIVEVLASLLKDLMSESDKKRHWNAITTILTAFIACSELSLKICRQCCQRNFVSDLLDYLVKYQKNYNKDKNLSTLTAKSLIILHNCSKAAENKQVYRQLGASEKIAPFLKSKNDDMAATSLFTLSYIIERSKQHLLKAENRVLIYILGIFDACLDDYSQERKGFSTSEIVVGLGNIAINDENKLSLVNNGVVPRLLRMMKRDSPVEQECAINTFTTLTKLKSTRNLIVDKYDAVQILSKHTDSDIEAVRHAAERAIAPLKNTPPRSAGQRKVSTSTSVSSASLNCNYRQLCLRFKKSLDLSDAYFAPEYDMCYCNSCHIERGDELYYARGLLPKDYGLPIGWCRFAIQVPARVAPLNVFHKWHVAFHGTRPDAVRPILECGDLLMPGDLEMEGRKLAERDGHFNEKSKPVGFDTKQIFLSPSIRYSGSNAYAYPSKFKDDIAKKVYWSKVAFQVWIKPESYNIGPQTIGAKYEIDPRFNNQELEWFTKRRGCIVVSGLLVNLQET